MRRITLRSNRRLFHKIFFSFALLCTLSLLIYHFVAVRLYARELERRTVTHSQIVMQGASEQLDRVFSGMDTLGSLFLSRGPQATIRRAEGAQGVERLHATVEIKRLLEPQMEYLGLDDWIDLVVIVGTTGESIYESSGTVRNEYNFHEMAWYGEFIESEKRAGLTGPHSQPYRRRYTAQGEAGEMFTFVRKLSAAGNPDETLAYLLVDFPAAKLAQQLEPFRLAEEGGVAAISAAGICMYTTDATLPARYPLERLEELRHAQSREVSYPEHKATVFLQYLSSADWYIISENPADLARKDSRVVSWTVLFILAGILVATVCMAGVIAYGVVRPVDYLKNAMTQVKNGDLQATAPVVTRDEIGELSAIFNDMLARLNALVDEVYKTQIREHQSTIHALEAQINPHFLYNTLENIRSIAYVEGVEPVEEMAVALSNMFRYSMRMESGLVPLRRELEHMEHYLSIIQIRYGNSLVVHNRIPPQLHNCPCMKFTLQPLVENAIIHGFRNCPAGKTIEIDGEVRGNALHLFIRDDGEGIGRERLEELRRELDDFDSPAKGLGLRNVHHRLRLTFGGEGGIAIASGTPVGTEISIVIPIREP